MRLSHSGLDPSEATRPPLPLAATPDESEAGRLIGAQYGRHFLPQYARQDEETAWTNRGCNPFSFLKQKIRQKVGTDDVVGGSGAERECPDVAAAEAGVVGDAVSTGVLAGDGDGDGIDIERVDLLVAEFGGGDGQQT